MEELEKKLSEYREAFGENYPLAFGSLQSNDDVIADIDRCIESGEKAKGPEYEDGVYY